MGLVNSIFYELVLLMAFILRNWQSGDVRWSTAIQNMVELPVALSFSLSMYFMLQHNTRAYALFLRLIACLRVDYVVCCCCRGIVVEQLKDYSHENPTAVQMSMHVKAHGKRKGGGGAGAGAAHPAQHSSVQISTSMSSQVSETNSANSAERQPKEAKGNTEQEPDFTITYANSDEKAAEPDRERERDTGAAASNGQVNAQAESVEESARTTTTTSDLERADEKNRVFFARHGIRF